MDGDPGLEFVQFDVGAELVDQRRRRLKRVDMTVGPNEFRSEDRVGKVAEMAKRLNPDLLIEVDGGISAGRTAGLVCAQGADVLVAGSGVFKAEDPEAAIGILRNAGAEVR